MNEQNTNGMKPLRPAADQAQTWENYKTPIPFDLAIKKVIEHHRQDGERNDIAVNGLRTWAFGTVDGSTMAIKPLSLPGRPESAAFGLRSNAWRQLCARLDIPADYMARMPAKIQIACTNYDIAKQEKDALLRCAGGEARALLSHRYAAFDDEMYLQMFDDTLKALGYRNDALVRSVASGPQTVIRVTIPNESMEIKKGDVIEFGVDAGNSELGLRSVQVTPVTYRLVCLNGMRAWKSEATHRMRHVGDPDKLREQMKDAIPVAFAEARGDLEKWKKATEILIDSAFVEIENLHSFGFTKPERESIGRQLAADNGLEGRNWIEQLSGLKTTVYDVANAITATGRERGLSEENLVRVDARLRFEEAGHEYLRRKAA